jgi:predicted membrane channel-forming protein YqfA (hemolysin III family)
VSTAVPIRPRREEIASALIQGRAAVASAVGLVYLVARASRQHNALGLAAIVVYGASMWVAFLASSHYHGVQRTRIKRNRTGWTVPHLRPRSPARVLSVISLATPF